MPWPPFDVRLLSKNVEPGAALSKANTLVIYCSSKIKILITIDLLIICAYIRPKSNAVWTAAKYQCDILK